MRAHNVLRRQFRYGYAGAAAQLQWNAVGAAAVGGVVSAGVEATGIGGDTRFGRAARAAAANLLAQRINTAAGLQDKFSWAAVATAGVGSYVGDWARGQIGDSVPAEAASAIVISVSTIANAAARTLIEGSDFGDNMLAALPDAIGAYLTGGLGDDASADDDAVINSKEEAAAAIGAKKDEALAVPQASAEPRSRALGAEPSAVSLIQPLGNYDGAGASLTLIQNGGAYIPRGSNSGLPIEPIPEIDPTPGLPGFGRLGGIVLMFIGVGSFAPHPDIEATNRIVTTFNNTVGEQLNQRTLDAARRELHGEVVRVNPRDAQPYDHITKVQQG